MGRMIDGQWSNAPETDDFERKETEFRNLISPDAPYPPESGRYHLYVSLACPWAHRALIMRASKGLEPHIDITVVRPEMLEHGWVFDSETGGDPINGVQYLYELYERSMQDYSGRVSVPILWDKQTSTIVNNESAEIMRIFNSAFDDLTGNKLDFYPEPLRPEIDAWNDAIYPKLNNGVYAAGFAPNQAVYDGAVQTVFAMLDEIEAQLDKTRYLCGDALTEADWRLFTTLVRFDAVYFGHFKCNIRSIEDYPNLSNYLRDLYQMPGIAQTVDLNQIKRHYYISHPNIDPMQIVPAGPERDFSRPHDRAEKFA